MMPKGKHSSMAAECQSCTTLRRGLSAALWSDLDRKKDLIQVAIIEQNYREIQKHGTLQNK